MIVTVMWQFGTVGLQKRAGAFTERADEFYLAHKSSGMLLSGPVRPLGEESEKM